MTILAIDPGAKESHWLSYDTEACKPLWCKSQANAEIVVLLSSGIWPEGGRMAIEIVRGYGVVAGNDTFETCEWAGRFMQAVPEGIQVFPVTRKEVKLHLCGNTTSRDKDIRQALLDRLGAQGTKKNPGPLYGISGHHWAALAVAVTVADKLQKVTVTEV